MIIVPGSGSGVDLPALSNPASASDIKNGKQVIGSDGNPITGTMAPSSEKTIIPTVTELYAIEEGHYAAGDIKVAGDTNLRSYNIKNGVEIFGVTGSYSVGSTGPINVETVMLDDAMDPIMVSDNGSFTLSIRDESILTSYESITFMIWSITLKDSNGNTIMLTGHGNNYLLDPDDPYDGYKLAYLNGEQVAQIRYGVVLGEATSSRGLFSVIFDEWASFNTWNPSIFGYIGWVI